MDRWSVPGDVVDRRCARAERVSGGSAGAPRRIPDLEDWWSAYRDLYEVVASIGERHTTSPHRAWFAVWEGHGFADHHAHRLDGPIDDDTRRGRDDEPTSQRGHPRRAARRPDVRAAAPELLPADRSRQRRDAVASSRHRRTSGATLTCSGPTTGDGSLRPTWTSGRSTSAATTTSSRALASNVPTPSEIVGFDRPLEIED